MHHNVVLMILEDIVLLLLIDIQPDAREFSFTNSLDEIIGINQAASRRIDQDHTILHLIDREDIDHMVGFLHERAVQRDQIALPEQLLQADILDEIQTLVRILVVAQHPHAIAPADPCHRRPDLAGSNDAGRLPIEVLAGQPLQGEVVLSHTDVGLVDVAVYRAGQRHRQLRDSLRRISRYPHYLDSIRCRRLKIYIIIAGAAHQKQLHASGGQNTQGVRPGICVHERTHCFAVCHVSGRLRVQLCLPVFQLQIRVVGLDCIKRFCVIRLRIKKCNSHKQALLSTCLQYELTEDKKLLLRQQFAVFYCEFNSTRPPGWRQIQSPPAPARPESAKLTFTCWNQMSPRRSPPSQKMGIPLRNAHFSRCDSSKFHTAAALRL